MQKTRLLSAGLWPVVTAAMLWGTIGIATQSIYSTETINSLFINLMRTLLATPILIVVGWRTVGRKMFQIPRRDLGLMVFTGVILAVSHASYFAAIRYCGVTIATLLTICLAPIIVSGLSVVLKLESFSGRLGTALAAALLGSVLLVGLNDAAAQHTNLPLGVGFAGLAAATYGGMILGGRLLANRDYHPLQTTAMMFAAGSITLIVLNAASGISVPQSPQVWLAIVYLAVIPTALAYGLFHLGLRTVPATTASIVSMLDPVVAALLTWWLFGETLSWAAIGGAALLLLSIGLLAYTPETVSLGGGSS
ncbi:MAG TPA: EamA family transporter [Phototrophicaceae bacterium]|nr:EamA family transporter [Phototrophicaceae bacterium]